MVKNNSEIGSLSYFVMEFIIYDKEPFILFLKVISYMFSPIVLLYNALAYVGNPILIHKTEWLGPNHSIVLHAFQSD